MEESNTNNTSVIFLDIDGVMIPGRNYIAGFPRTFDPLACGILKHICGQLNPCRIVFNSTWNKLSGMLQDAVKESDLMLCKWNNHITNKITIGDTTPYPHVHDRLEAIEAWLDGHDTSGNWVAFDDCYFNKAPPHERFVNIDPMMGITCEAYYRAMRLLGKPDEKVIIL